MATVSEKPSFRRRLAQFLCSHHSWQGTTYRDDDGTECVTVRRCLSCGLMTWVDHGKGC